MNRLFSILIGAVLLTSCYKDEVDVAEMNMNPFDREYQGPAVFELIGTYQETVTVIVWVGDPPDQTPVATDVVQQVIEFKVKEDLLPGDASYSVQVKEPGVALQTLDPVPPGSNIFKYHRNDPPAPGVEICLELRLSNNGSTAGAETICATL